MSNDYILAIDNGTQSVRALIFDLQGHLVDKAQVEIDSYQAPQPGWVENDPEEFWRALSLACQRSVGQHQRAESRPCAAWSSPRSAPP
jgi:sugar (pentulose or hexulose) kinase